MSSSNNFNTIPGGRSPFTSVQSLGDQLQTDNLSRHRCDHHHGGSYSKIGGYNQLARLFDPQPRRFLGGRLDSLLSFLKSPMTALKFNIGGIRDLFESFRRKNWTPLNEPKLINATRYEPNNILGMSAADAEKHAHEHGIADVRIIPHGTLVEGNSLDRERLTMYLDAEGKVNSTMWI